MEVKFFDRYTWHARTLPVYFTSVSAVLAIAAALPEGLNLPLASASGVVFVPLSYFFSQVGSDFGKRLEPSLWRSWGGPPTTRYLRHTNDEFNAATRERVHTRLREIGLEIPTAAEEESDPDRADELYASAIDELRRRTRPGDTNRFPLVYTGNIEYGFRRNLLGLKKIGVGVSLVSLGAAGWALLNAWNTAGGFSPVPVVTTLLTVCIVLGWLLGVRPDAVRLTADRYARFLLEAALELVPE